MLQAFRDNYLQVVYREIYFIIIYCYISFTSASLVFFLHSPTNHTLTMDNFYRALIEGGADGGGNQKKETTKNYWRLSLSLICGNLLRMIARAI